jgi:hypothetical protein
MPIDIKRILNSDTGKTIISVLLGFGVACLFHKVCKDKDCIHFSGPVISNIEDKIFQHDNKCYTYKAKAVKCNPAKKTVEFTAEHGGGSDGEKGGTVLPPMTSLSSSSFIPSFFTPIQKPA